MRYLIFIIAASFTQTLFSQQQVLIDNTWYLDKIVISENEYFVPNNEELSNNVIATFYGGSLNAQVCNTLSGGLVFNEAENSFTTSSWSVTLAECAIYENEVFENRLFYEFWSINFTEIPQPFNYEIIEYDNYLELVITNIFGNQAYYRTAHLSILETSASQEKVLLAFNEGKLIVRVNNNQFEIKKILIFDSNGKLVKETSNLNQNKPMNVANLPDGLYFISLVKQDGLKINRKILKK